MNRKLQVICAVGLLAVTTLYASDSGAGSANDPLVTKSYVDKKIAEISPGSGAGGDTAERLRNQEKLISELIGEINSLKQGSSSTYTVVSIPQGKSILGKQGAEIIIRGGEGRVLSAEAGGIQDMTAGVDINGGATAPRYHLLIIPREDGRGLLAVKELTVMVRGGYTIQ